METLYLLVQLLKGAGIFLLLLLLMLYFISMTSPGFALLAIPLALYGTYLIMSGKAKDI